MWHCSFVGRYQCLRKLVHPSIFRVEKSLILKMEVSHPSKTLVPMYQTKWFHTTEDLFTTMRTPKCHSLGVAATCYCWTVSALFIFHYFASPRSCFLTGWSLLSKCNQHFWEIESRQRMESWHKNNLLLSVGLLVFSVLLYSVQCRSLYHFYYLKLAFENVRHEKWETVTHSQFLNDSYKLFQKRVEVVLFLTILQP